MKAYFSFSQFYRSRAEDTINVVSQCQPRLSLAAPPCLLHYMPDLNCPTPNRTLIISFLQRRISEKFVLKKKAKFGRSTDHCVAWGHLRWQFPFVLQPFVISSKLNSGIEWIKYFSSPKGILQHNLEYHFDRLGRLSKVKLRV